MTERERMTPSDVNKEAFPDPDEPKARTAGPTYLIVIGGLLLVLVLVAVYFLT